MSRLRLKISMSLDGFVAGPDQSVDNPLGIEQARSAARGYDVSLAGGAKAAAQYLQAGLVDEMEINHVPVLLGRGYFLRPFT